MKVEERHLTGIALDRIETTHVRYERGVPGNAKSWYDLLTNIKLSVKAQVQPDASATDVFVSCSIDGAPGWTLEGEVCGHFRVPSGRATPVDLQTFSRLHAVAILLPYVRQLLSNVTGADARLGGPFLLPPMNVARLLEERDEEAKESAANRGVEKQ